MVQFIDDYKDNYGTLAICRVLPIAPSTYYRAKDLKSCPEKRSPYSQLDDFYIGEIKRIWHYRLCRYDWRLVRQCLG